MNHLRLSALTDTVIDASVMCAETAAEADVFSHSERNAATRLHDAATLLRLAAEKIDMALHLIEEPPTAP